MEAIQKQTEKALTFESQPDEYLQKFEKFLVTIQDAYRSKLSDPEQQLWIRSLCLGQERFSMQEIVSALDEMVKNPPLYEVQGPDGPVMQKWNGLPTLPQLFNTMLSLRKERAREAYRQREQEQREEQQELEKRRAEHPEEFFGWADVLKLAQETIPISTGHDGAQAPTICVMAPEPVSPVLMSDELALRRREQMTADLEMHLQRKKAGQ